MNPPLNAAVPYSEVQRREAADWFVIIHAEEDPNAETLQSWLRWLDQDEGNRTAFERIAQVWHGTPTTMGHLMPDRKDVLSDAYEADQSVEEWLKERVESRSQPSGVRPGTAQQVRGRKWIWLAAAALAAVAIGITSTMRYAAFHGSQVDLFATRSGEQIELTLADGSRVWLGPRSTLQVNFTADRRGLRLIGGEAFFSVRKDHSRPFVVSSASGDITAVGTAFNVRTVPGRVTVSVSEGVVTVA
ncbi:MAG: hypothetical protein RL684_1175, partial [Pseudomonadota bacterium]